MIIYCEDGNSKGINLFYSSVVHPKTPRPRAQSSDRLAVCFMWRPVNKRKPPSILELTASVILTNYRQKHPVTLEPPVRSTGMGL